MARPHPHKRAARLAAISILSVLGAVAAVWAAPRVSDAVAAWMSTPPVELRTTSLGAALPVVAGGRRDRRPRGGGAATLVAADAARRLAPAVRPPRRPSTPACASPWPACAARRRRAPARCACGCAPARTGGPGVAGTRSRSSGSPRRAGRSRRSPSPSGPAPGGTCRWPREAGGGDEPAPVAPARRARRDHQQHRGRRPHGRGRRRPAPGGRDRRRAPPHARRRGDDDQAEDRDPRRSGAPTSPGAPGRPTTPPVKMAFVHHTDSGNDYTAAEAPAVVRGVYAYHTKSLHWSDVGYNFLIDRYGTIYEGRYGGVDARRHRRAGPRLQHREHGHLGHRHVQRRHAAVARGHGPGATAGVEARRPPRRPAGHGDAALRLRPEVRHRPAGDVPGHRRPSRRQLHGLPRRAGCTRSCPPCARWSRAPASPRSTASSSPTRPSARTATACATAPPSASRSPRAPPGRVDDPRRRRPAGASA